MANIYKYDNEFDRDKIYGKLAELDEKIQDIEESGELSREREKKIRELKYAQFLAGLRLNTGYGRF